MPFLMAENPYAKVLDYYFKDIRKFPLLTQREESELVSRVKGGDRTASEKLVNSNLKLVVSVAKRYVNRGLPFEDLISAGNIGLIESIPRYTPNGARFSTYAYFHIRQKILREIYGKSRTIKLPISRSDTLIRINKIIEYLADKKSQYPSIGEIAEYLGISGETVCLLLTRDSETFPLTSSYPGDEKQDVEKEAIDNTAKEDVNAILSALDKEEREVIEKRYGLNGSYPQSLEEISLQIPLSRERIRQIEKKGLRKMRRTKEVKKIYDYL